jgi:Flp pilus assembly pilin Flp
METKLLTLEGQKMKLFKLKSFKDDESGAVTVDWVVLTAALVIIGGTVVGIVKNGMNNLASDIDSALSSTSTS